LLPLVELHVGIGLYRIAVKWGLAGRAERKGLKRGENLLTLIFIAIGLLTLARFWFLKG
ncbi:MAG: succinate dehydrogenase/fumarate reductase cytochrome b subunit, partial [Humidesulfovibrio sp.]|nr:succinate dehydrogenase/fumarate reductase cytochrome b subunit [Humidesulfovibrio sp.]